MTLRFCSAAETDLEAISQLDASAFEFPWSFADFEGSLKAGHQFLLLKDDDRLLGFAVYMQIFEQSELLTIAVTPSEQGMGYGKLILNEVLARLAANQAESLFLEVRVSNTRARALYHIRLGFKKFLLEKVTIRLVTVGKMRLSCKNYWGTNAWLFKRDCAPMDGDGHRTAVDRTGRG